MLRDIEKYIYWSEKDQQYFPHYWRKEILPKWLGFDAANTQQTDGVTPVAAVGGVTPPVGYKQPYYSLGLDSGFGTPFEIRSIVFSDGVDLTPTSQVTVLMQDTGEKRQFMNQPVHIRAIAGVAQTPALLREPYMFKSQHTINVQFAKIVGGATTIRMLLCGAEYFPWSPEFLRRQQAHEKMLRLLAYWDERRKWVNPYWLTTDQPIELLGGAAGEFFLKIGDDGHFEGFTITAISVQDGDFSWELSEPKTQQTIMNGFATLTNSIGDANFPTMLPAAYLIPAGYRLRLRIQDLSGAPNTIFFTIQGRKIYAPFRQVKEVLADTQPPTSVPTPADQMPLIVPSSLVK